MKQHEERLQTQQVDVKKLVAVREERLAAGQCPTCGQQLYTFKAGSICCCIVSANLRKIPLTVPNLVERGQCCRCELHNSSKSLQTLEVSSCWSENGITGSPFGSLLDPVANHDMVREAGHDLKLSLKEKPSTGSRTGSPASVPGDTGSMKTAVYEGGYNGKGEKHGEGVMTWSNGDVFKGTFVNDKRCGHGTIEFSGANQDGGEYVGEWRDDKMHGDGTRRYPNGDMYVGNFDEGKREGEGRFYFSNGDMYFGEWKNNQMHGSGHYYFSSGTRFEGMFLFNKRNGKGKTQSDSGNLDIFQYINDERVGQGVRFDAKRTRAWRLVPRPDGAIRQIGSAPLDRHRITMSEAVSLVYEIENASNSYIEDLLASRGVNTRNFTSS
ncbi:amyotrophic lateral sclerosis 2 protein [Fistulifera solaris]|uniref:Amyotrophic lateral sclerosis 2 protein n=1 Tax=Fistulifera solaris TaxID=1519565 RepID=A0A1Z5JUG0_FISSO|nr:amyotrophic lateral sclerosis 2 protein [Fistulifera solaris]|eukprot:GAX17667.1 amyotrophic lateral sclerosis 2 protein [Fistulifera solaris]